MSIKKTLLWVTYCSDILKENQCVSYKLLNLLLGSVLILFSAYGYMYVITRILNVVPPGIDGSNKCYQRGAHQHIWAHPKFSFLQFARQFFLAQWIRDNHVEMERCLRTPVEDPLDSGEGLTNDSFIDAQSITKLEDKKAFLLSILDGRNVSTIRYVDLYPLFSYSLSVGYNSCRYIYIAT